MRIKDEILREKESYSKNKFTYSYIKNLNKPPENIGNWGMCDLTIVVYGYCVGYKKLYEPFLSRIIEWISEGIENNEDFGDLVFHQYDLTSELALATWLKTGKSDLNLWKKTLVWQEDLHSREDYSKSISRVDKEMIASSMHSLYSSPRI